MPGVSGFPEISEMDIGEDSSYGVKTPYDQAWMDAHNGLDCFFGTNVRWIKKRIYQLERVDCNNHQQQELESKRVEIGLTRSGEKKPGVCWNYIEYGCCEHVSHVTDGQVLGGRWHPAQPEYEYLKGKAKNGQRRNKSEHLAHKQQQEIDFQRHLKDRNYFPDKL
jgi:hypothetical protein